MAQNKLAIEKKLDELLTLIAKSDISKETASYLLERLSAAIKHQKDGAVNGSRKTPVDEFSILLPNNQFDNKISIRRLRGDRLSRIVLVMIGMVMIALGFAMIIMPAPPFFEMYTIFYFTRDDGITLMDLISLLIILAGAYFLIRSIHHTSRTNRL